MQIICETEVDLERFVKEFTNKIKVPCVIGLKGPLGAGKTTFVKYLAKSLGSQDFVSSPSYVLEQRYRMQNNYELIHWDVYRLQQLPDDLLEQIQEQQMLVIEWVDKFPELSERLSYLIEIQLKETKEGLVRIIGLA